MFVCVFVCPTYVCVRVCPYICVRVSDVRVCVPRYLWGLLPPGGGGGAAGGGKGGGAGLGGSLLAGGGHLVQAVLPGGVGLHTARGRRVLGIQNAV